MHVWWGNCIRKAGLGGGRRDGNREGVGVDRAGRDGRRSHQHPRRGMGGGVVGKLQGCMAVGGGGCDGGGGAQRCRSTRGGGRGTMEKPLATSGKGSAQRSRGGGCSTQRSPSAGGWGEVRKGAVAPVVGEGGRSWRKERGGVVEELQH
uniref:Glycine-rich cell wall structural protein 1-like n=1 Tax=Elaeis guineensis var. tenera TaxID=51953 RepID=A0A6I9Q963_ELAGV|nr:glycine-rich cell wall structural protein 1-like [Elaeis guineensis]